jgi:hypothetical protein
MIGELRFPTPRSVVNPNGRPDMDYICEAKHTICNGPSEEANTAADEASDKTVGTRELARLCNNTAQDQHSKASG